MEGSMMTKSFAMQMSKEQFAAVFGTETDQTKAGRSRLCAVCGGWHSLDAPWPHNCRSPAPPRNPELASPQIFPTFEPFKPNHFDDAIINDRRQKRDYMERHDLAEYDTGIKPDAGPTEREWEAQFVSDIKAAREMDPLAVEPVDVIGRTDLNHTPEIDIAAMPVADQGPKDQPA